MKIGSSSGRGSESEAHHLLKLELASAARDAGAHAELEVRAPDGSWRADVLATDPGGAWAMALEAQLSPITGADITARTDRMREHGVISCWFSDRPRPPWLGTVPSLRLATADTGGVVVAEGLVKFAQGGWALAPQVPVADFLRWCSPARSSRTARAPGFSTRSGSWRRCGPRRSTSAPRTPTWSKRRSCGVSRRSGRPPTGGSGRRSSPRSTPRTQSPARRTLRRATAVEESVRRLHGGTSSKWHGKIMSRPGVQQAVDYLAREHGIAATAGLSVTEARWAGGVPLVGQDGVPVAVLSPEPGQVNGEAFRLLAGMLLLFPTRKQEQRFDRNTRRRRKVPIDGYRTEHVLREQAERKAEPEPADGCRRREGPCSCTEPHLAVKISGAEYPAEPSREMGPAAALYTAVCRTCGGPYEGPWRRTGTSSVPAPRTSPEQGSPAASPTA